MPHRDSQDLDPLLTRVQPGTSPHHCPRIFISSNLLQHITRSRSISSHVPHLGLSPMHPEIPAWAKSASWRTAYTLPTLSGCDTMYTSSKKAVNLLWSELLLLRGLQGPHAGPKRTREASKHLLVLLPHLDGHGEQFLSRLPTSRKMECRQQPHKRQHSASLVNVMKALEHGPS